MEHIKNSLVAPTDLPSHVKSEFELMAAYLADVYHNTFVRDAQDKLSRKAYTTLTEAYRYVISRYPNSFKDDDLAVKIFRDYYNYKQHHVSVSKFDDSIFEIVKSCIPEEYFEYMDAHQKLGCLCDIWSKTTHELTSLIYQHYLSTILDTKDPSILSSNIRQLQDEIVNLLSLRREDLLDKFHQASKGGKRGGKIEESSHKDRSRKHIDKLMKERKELSEKIEKLAKVATRYKEDRDSIYRDLSREKKENAELQVKLSTIIVLLKTYIRKAGEDPDHVLAKLKKHSSHKDRDRSRSRSRSRERSKERDRKRDKDKERVREKERDKERGREKEKEKEKEKDKEYLDYNNPANFVRDAEEKLRKGTTSGAEDDSESEKGSESDDDNVMGDTTLEQDIIRIKKMQEPSAPPEDIVAKTNLESQTQDDRPPLDFY
jgi:hypothetical protein